MLARNVVFVPLQFLPAILVGKMVNRAPLVEAYTAQLASNNAAFSAQHTGTRVKIPLQAGIALDAFEISCPAYGGKWVIW